MSFTSAAFREAFHSRGQVGQRRPTADVRIRRGRFVRAYAPWDGDSFGEVGGRPADADQWQATWTPTEAYVDLPNWLEFTLEGGFDTRGVETCTIEMDNVAYVELTGTAGAYHLIEKGYYAPIYGYDQPGRPASTKAQNDWFERLNSAAQITIREGYGSETDYTFTGMIDDVEESDKPNKIRLVCRNFAAPLTDQKTFGDVKDRKLRDPIIFAPAGKKEDEERVGGGAKASSESSGYPARFVLDTDSSTYWRSAGNGVREITEWVQIRLPTGTYKRFYIYPYYDNMEMWVSLYLRPRGRETAPTFCKMDGKNLDDEFIAADGYEIGPNALIPYGFMKLGLGSVPGGNGGHPFIIHKERVPNRGHFVDLPGEIALGADSVLRVSFRHLGVSTVSAHDHRTTYRAGVRRLIAMRRKKTGKTKGPPFIYIRDVSEIVKVVCRWAGFKDLSRIEICGVTMKKPMVVNKANSLRDIIAKVEEQTGYVFRIDPPTDDSSIGVPVFTTNNAFSSGGRNDMETLRSSEALFQMTRSWKSQPLRYIIRVRGAIANKKQGGLFLGGDRVRRHMYVLRPPWARRMGGVIRHLTWYKPELETRVECMVAAYLIALNIALANATAIAEGPGAPHLSIGDVVQAHDQDNGIVQTLYITNHSRTFRRGAEPSYRSQVGGPMMDTPDIFNLSLRYLGELAQNDINAI